MAMNINDPASVHRQLKIKVGATQRLLKEHGLYGKEAEDQKRKVDKMVADNADEYEIKNARRIQEESVRMIKDTTERLGKTVQDLRDLIVQVKQHPQFAEDEELIKAEEALEQASV
ncbi:tubulin binding cofactor A [Coniophora puteana RWD-64-598 SS2]|uniref:Tubulin-specific chaperone A n=1 Tax=Coniophora puteana (strain RWD-64-598) TaxID=741705 RepID=A0A5M3N720_CONPW|nr:tubulin binding cofactor A [Coniophora puteana RWD-64-598 SS2]EIW87116.1 tubulin binding cofactor A [Coniophora puteana RWD-64-598 SS2]